MARVIIPAKRFKLGEKTGGGRGGSRAACPRLPRRLLALQQGFEALDLGRGFVFGLPLGLFLPLGRRLGGACVFELAADGLLLAQEVLARLEA